MHPGLFSQKKKTVTLSVSLNFIIFSSLFLFFLTVKSPLSLGQVNWTKYENNPVLTPGSPGSWDEKGINAVAVVYVEGQYQLWYEGWDSMNVNHIGYATSPDGIHWTKYPINPVLKRGEPGSWDQRDLYEPAVIFDGTTYHMWFTGANTTYPFLAIGYATSPDGIKWQKHPENPVLEKNDEEGEWDDYIIVCPCAVKNRYDYYMWYTGRSRFVDSLKIGVAFSGDGSFWQRYNYNPVLTAPQMPGWDQKVVRCPFVTYDGTTFHMFYDGADGVSNDIHIGYATSTDAVNWKKYSDNPVLNFGYQPSVIFDSTMCRMWFTMYRNVKGLSIGYATAPRENVTSVSVASALPNQFHLYQNTPNPFQDKTTILFEVRKPTHISLEIFNLLGQRIRVLYNTSLPAGTHQVMWNGRNNYGGLVGSGIYICKMRTEHNQHVRKLVISR